MPYSRKHLRKKYSSRRYRRAGRLKHIELLAVYCFAIVGILVIIIAVQKLFDNPSKSVAAPIDRLAAFNVPYKSLPLLKELSSKYAINFAELTTLYTLENQFFPSKSATPQLSELEKGLIENYAKIKKTYDQKAIEPYIKIFDSIFSEMKYFPIPSGYDKDDVVSFMYGDSWNAQRVYGGDRPHQGTDILDRENTPGRIPIVSMTSGVIRDIGWNELGGYHIGVVTGNGNYYYYAHLDSFSKTISKDMSVMPGQLLGFMGNTGYSKKEGTKGNFVTHLHVGILVNTKLTNKELWMNPYPFLRFVEGSRAEYVKE